MLEILKHKMIEHTEVSFQVEDQTTTSILIYFKHM